jgi:hypothetical protein
MAGFLLKAGANAALEIHNDGVRERNNSKKAVHDYLLGYFEPELAKEMTVKLYLKFKKGFDTSFTKELNLKNVRKKLQEPATREFVREHLRRLETLKMEAQHAGILIDGRVLTAERGYGKIPLGACGIVVGFSVQMRDIMWSIGVSFPEGKYGPHAGLIRSIRQFKCERKWSFYGLSTRQLRA